MDWWPIVAGSPDHACLVWQRYVNSTYVNLMYAVYDPATNSYVKGIANLETNVKYYTYDVQYYPGLNAFLIVGAYASGGGFAYLVDDQGNVLAKNTSIPALQRECRGAHKDFNGYSLAAYPADPNGVYVLSVTPAAITLSQTVPDTYAWVWAGTDGVFVDDNTLLFASLSPMGIVERQLSLNNSGTQFIVFAYAGQGTAASGTFTPSGGTITSAGNNVVPVGSSITFAITPATGYKISSVSVDGVSVGAVSAYTFSGVTANHTIAAIFAKNSNSGSGAHGH